MLAAYHGYGQERIADRLSDLGSRPQLDEVIETFELGDDPDPSHH